MKDTYQIFYIFLKKNLGIATCKHIVWLKLLAFIFLSEETYIFLLRKTFQLWLWFFPLPRPVLDFQSSLLFMTPICLSILSQKEEEEEGGMIEQHMVWSVSAGRLNWGIPFLNHDNSTQNGMISVAEDSKFQTVLVLHQSLWYSWKQIYRKSGMDKKVGHEKTARPNNSK